MKMRTAALRPCAPTSALTNSKPCSAATRSAISHMRCSMSAVANPTPPQVQKTVSRPKEKVGANPLIRAPRSDQEADYTASAGKRAKADGERKRGRKGEREKGKETAHASPLLPSPFLPFFLRSPPPLYP